MRSITTLLFLIIASFRLFAQEITILKNVAVVSPSTNAVLYGFDVTVENGSIESIKKTTNKKHRNATVIDATGKYLMPGLADMHVHIPRQKKYGYGADEFLMLQLAAGVTAVRSMRGADADLVLQKQISEGQKIGPSIYTSAPPFYASRVWASGDSLVKLLTRYKQQGYQSLKVLSVPSVSWFDTLAQTAKKQNLKLSGHVPAGILIDAALDNNLNSIEHLGGYENLSLDSDTFKEAIKQTVSKKVFNCATLDWYFVNYTQITYDEMKQRAGLDRLPTAIVKDWTKTFDDYFADQSKKHPDSLKKEHDAEKIYVDKKLQILRILNQAGAKFLISPDASTVFQVPGLSMIEEMKWYKRAGLSNFDILKAATFNAAKYVGEQDKWGSIQKGMKADLVLLEANPLDDVENIRKIVGVMKNGQWFDKAKLNEMIQTIKSNYREQP